MAENLHCEVILWWFPLFLFVVGYCARIHVCDELMKYACPWRVLEMDLVAFLIGNETLDVYLFGVIYQNYLAIVPQVLHSGP